MFSLLDIWLLIRRLVQIFFFFFQAEDGIRDTSVTGVQTCALPISAVPSIRERAMRQFPQSLGAALAVALMLGTAGAAEIKVLSIPGVKPAVSELLPQRSEERRVGKEGRSGGGTEH